MPSRTLVSVDEYLHTSYDPDCDYVDGEIVERNVGETDHSDLQGEIICLLSARGGERLAFIRLSEQRVQVSPTRFRIPDVCVVAGSKPTEQILTKPPLIAVEILSKDDRVSQMQERIDDYLKFGVRYVWVIDPRTRRAWIYTSDGATKPRTASCAPRILRSNYRFPKYSRLWSSFSTCLASTSHSRLTRSPALYVPSVVFWYVCGMIVTAQHVALQRCNRQADAIDRDRAFEHQVTVQFRRARES